METTRTAADVQLLAESLDRLPEPTATPALIVVSGLPGTGNCGYLQGYYPRY